MQRNVLLGVVGEFSKNEMIENCMKDLRVMKMHGFSLANSTWGTDVYEG